MTAVTTPGSTSNHDRISDQQLGRELGVQIAHQASSNLPYSVVFSQLQDLLGEDTALLGPLRDLLGRPAFQQLVGLKRHSLQMGARDALLQDLALTYNSGMVTRLAAVVDGCLGLPLTPVPPAAQQPVSGIPASSWSSTTPHSHSPASTPIVPPNPPPAESPKPQAINPPTGNPGTSLLIALVALLSGAVLVGLAWLFFGNRIQQGAASAPQSSETPHSETQPADTPEKPAVPPTPKDLNAPSQEGAWGSASAYKFGQLPGGEYPQSCAFSSTDPSGRFNTDKTQLEFWACRDVGGNAESGYKVVWADGKETTYTFGSDGEGAVVGTNGTRYPMRWRNDNHKGESIIVINHQDGAISWIPGNVR